MTRARDLADLGGNTSQLENTGLVRLNTTTLSATSSVNIDNIFTSTYTNYLLVIKAVAGTGDPDLTIKLRAGGVTTTDSNYVRQYHHTDNATVSAGRASSQTFFRGGGFSATVMSSTNINIYNPQKAAATAFFAHNTNIVNGGSLRFEAYSHSTATAYDGIELACTSSSLTGILTIYGYRE